MRHARAVGPGQQGPALDFFVGLSRSPAAAARRARHDGRIGTVVVTVTDSESEGPGSAALTQTVMADPGAWHPSPRRRMPASGLVTKGNGASIMMRGWPGLVS